MKRTAICLFVSIAIAGWASAVSAQGAADKEKDKDKKEKAGGEEGGAGGSEPIEADLDVGTTPDAKSSPDAASVKAAANLSWADIVVVPRKAFLKGGRFEIGPYTGVSVNDILIRHFVFGVDLNFFLSDAMWIGIQGNYYKEVRTERESLVGLQYNRIPTLNRNLYGAALNLGYVPAYGKFALFNSSIIHWEVYISGGFGITRTEIIPRIPGDEVFGTNALTPNFAIGGRFFLFDWLTLNYAVRDYIVIDRFEPTMRAPEQTIAQVEAAAPTRMVNNIMFYVGAGIYLPTKFTYRTPR
jgi:outer membrane beta-barrel protein